MTSQIDDLVKMRDIETLYELMAEDDDWMIQLDAAEGLVKLDDKRGLEFLLSAKLSEDEEICAVAKEILDAPALKRMLDEIKAEEKRQRQGKVDTAKKRLQKGRKVFLYKLAFLPTGSLLDDDLTDEGIDISALGELGLEGWEVVNMIPRRARRWEEAWMKTSRAYFLLKKEVGADESAELDEM